ncbi:MAG: inositol monophosphatase family protein [Alphaproteobacteria bacterium]|nr:inositol monophosphatase family protein [Alphaproteobacteria bacterium]
MKNFDLDMYFQELCDLALEASKKIMSFYGDPYGTTRKKDGSFVTLADRASEAIILKKLKELTPNIEIISEETFADNPITQLQNGDFWCVDPIDGTDGFVNQNGMFCINIALILNYIPIFGLIAHPPTEKIWIGTDKVAWMIEKNQSPQKLCSTNPMKAPVKAVTSTHYTPRLQHFIEENQFQHAQKLGSALKFCALAEGQYDIYPRLSAVCEWDIAAGDAILKGAGGCILDMQGNPVTYGNDGFKTKPFIAYSKAPTERSV